MTKTKAPVLPAPTSSVDLHKSMEYHFVSMAAIIASPTNPRKHFEENSIIDLAQSMKESGLLQAITLRPIGAAQYEIVAGERRYRAAKLLNWTDIKAGVADFTDGEVLELQILENLQRENVRPLDEAAAFKSLLEKQDIDWLTTRIHKPKKYVFDRLKLNNLVPAAAEYVERDVLPLGHAVLISKLAEKEQMKVLEFCIGRPDYSSDRKACTQSLDAIKNFIAREFMLDFMNVPFDHADALLHPEAGACKVCPKRTCNNNLLFADITKDDKCTDSVCFNKKLELHLTREKNNAVKVHGSFLAGDRSSIYSSGEVKVQGIQVPYKTAAFKGSVAVVITKVDRGSHSRKYLGNTVFVSKASITKEQNKKSSSKGSGNNHVSWQKQQEATFKKVSWPRLQLLKGLTASSEKLDADIFCRFLRDVNDDIIHGLAVVLDVHPFYTTLEDIFSDNKEIDEAEVLADCCEKIVDHFGVAIMPGILQFLDNVEGSDSAAPTKRTVQHCRFDYNWKETIAELTFKKSK